MSPKLSFASALTIHIIHNHYTWSASHDTLTAFNCGHIGGFTNELVGTFKDYVHSFPYLTNNVLNRIQFVAHHLTMLDANSQYEVLEWLKANSE